MFYISCFERLYFWFYGKVHHYEFCSKKVNSKEVKVCPPSHFNVHYPKLSHTNFQGFLKIMNHSVSYYICYFGSF